MKNWERFNDEHGDHFFSYVVLSAKGHWRWYICPLYFLKLFFIEPLLKTPIYFESVSRTMFEVKWGASHSVVFNSLWPHGLYSPWNSLGQNTGVGSLSLLQGIFLTQGTNPGLPHCRQILYQLSHKGSPRVLEWVAYPFSSGSSRPRNRTGVSCIAGGVFTNWAIRGSPVNVYIISNSFFSLPSKNGPAWSPLLEGPTPWGSHPLMMNLHALLVPQMCL